MELLLRFNSMVHERRRYLRHKTHSPAYASIGAGVGGVVLDANESGAAVESVARLAPQSFVDLRLDLLEMHSSAVTPARVAWCDEGRVGLEFLNLTGESRRQLQQWLLMNALLATESASQLPQKQQAEYSATAQRQEAAGDAALMAVAERALAATGADGAAIALAEGAEMVCRATAGEIAPPPGTKLEAQRGISGACVRSGRWLRCDDPQLDANIDRESCRALGINSVVAVPIIEQGNVLGVMEVFSRQTYAFQEEHCAALQALAESLASSLQTKKAEPSPAAAEEPVEKAVEPAAAEETPVAAQPVAAAAPVAVAEPAAAAIAPVSEAPAAAAPESGSQPVFTAEVEQPAASAGTGQRIVILGLAAALLIVGLWFMLSRNTSEMRQVDAAEPSGSQAVEQPASAGAGENSAQGASSGAEMSSSLRDLRRRAQGGDAEAQFELGAKYATGEDVAQDYSEGVKWFTRAAEGGQVLAAATLGAYYWAGRGVPQDDVSAYMWSSIARQEGDEASRYRIAILRARMTAQQIMEGEQRADRWREVHFRPPAGSTSRSPQ